MQRDTASASSSLDPVLMYLIPVSPPMSPSRSALSLTMRDSIPSTSRASLSAPLRVRHLNDSSIILWEER